MPDYVLDSYALLAYFNAESAGTEVKGLLEQAELQDVSLFLSLINLGEIYYLVYRRRGPTKAQEMLKILRSLPIKLFAASETRILAAAALKAQYPVSYADAFAAALANELGAMLVTGDAEFQAMEPDLKIFWLL